MSAISGATRNLFPEWLSPKFPPNFFKSLHKIARMMILFLPTLASIITATLLAAPLSKIVTAGAITLGVTSTILLITSLSDHS